MWKTDLGSTLAELKLFEGDLVNPEVQRARSILRVFLSPSLDYANRFGYVYTMHGSLVYNDPRNLDADVTIVGDEFPRSVMQHFWGIEDKLGNSWPWNGSTDMSFAIMSEMGQDNLHDDDLMLALVLSSELVYPRNRQQVVMYEGYRNMALQILEENPVLATGVILVLNSAIAVRKARRASI